MPTVKSTYVDHKLSNMASFPLFLHINLISILIEFCNNPNWNPGGVLKIQAQVRKDLNEFLMEPRDLPNLKAA